MVSAKEGKEDRRMIRRMQITEYEQNEGRKSYELTIMGGHTEKVKIIS